VVVQGHADAGLGEIMEWFDVTREQVVAVLGFVARSADAPADRATAEIIRARAEAAEMEHAHSV
jgi:hypothetical protein